MLTASLWIRRNGINPGFKRPDHDRTGAKPVSRLLATLEQQHGENDVVLSAITVMELEHGLCRAQTVDQVRNRRNYLNTVFAAMPVESFGKEMAQIAAKVDAEARRTGSVIPVADLLIGATALH